MKRLVVLSGKGGTGKTTIAAALAMLWQGQVLCLDADVDAANLHLLLPPQGIQETPFVGARIPQWQQERCNGCGKCTELCRFHAIEAGRLSILRCEGCGLCALACPQQALAMVDRVTGFVSVGTAVCGPLLQARLLPGAGNSGKLVSRLKEEAEQLSKSWSQEWLLCDGPPGIGCPTMAALAGSDALLAVAEPSASGLHDLKRLLDLANHFGIAAYVCVNKADLAPDFAAQVDAECRRRQVPMLVEIPYDPGVSQCARRGETVVQYPESSAAAALRTLAGCLREILQPAGATAVVPVS